jgi:hypothetical protein
MDALPVTQDLLSVAKRVVWFKQPAQALADPVHFIAHVMTYGMPDDLRILQSAIGPDAYLEVLDNAPPGVFDARSWAYWNLKFGRPPRTASAGAQHSVAQTG